MEEIINKVAQSSLETFDLEDFFPKEKFVALDISQWLSEGILLKERYIDYLNMLVEIMVAISVIYLYIITI